MAFRLADNDYRATGEHLDAVLKACKNGTISLSQARASLAHVMTAAAIDNEGGKRYTELDPEEIFYNA